MNEQATDLREFEDYREHVRLIVADELLGSYYHMLIEERSAGDFEAGLTVRECADAVLQYAPSAQVGTLDSPEETLHEPEAATPEPEPAEPTPGVAQLHDLREYREGVRAIVLREAPAIYDSSYIAKRTTGDFRLGITVETSARSIIAHRLNVRAEAAE